MIKVINFIQLINAFRIAFSLNWKNAIRENASYNINFFVTYGPNSGEIRDEYLKGISDLSKEIDQKWK